MLQIMDGTFKCSTSYGLTTNICKKNVLCCTELCFENDSDNASNRLSDNDDGDS